MILPRCLQLILLLCILVLVGLLAVACGSEPTPTPTSAPAATPTPTPTPFPTPTLTPEPTATLQHTAVAGSFQDSLVPDGAALVVDADLSVILDSPVLAPVIDVLFGGAGSGESVFGKFERDTGISLRSIVRAEMYMNNMEALSTLGRDSGSGEPTDPPTLGVLLRGDLDEEEFLAGLQNSITENPNLTYQAVDYRGYRVYVDANRDPENFSFAFVDDDTLLLGSNNGVEAMLDVASGATSPISGDSVVALDALGDRDIGMIMVTPPEAIEANKSGNQETPGLMGALGAGAVNVPLSVAKISLAGESMKIQSVQFLEDETDAVAYKEYNEGTMALLGAMSGSAELQKLVEEIGIKQDGMEVSFTMTIDAAELSAVLDFLPLMMQAGTP